MVSDYTTEKDGHPFLTHVQHNAAFNNPDITMSA